MERRLRRAGFDTRAVETAEAASRVVFGMRPDLIILNIDTPRYSGVDFHEYLRTTDRGRSIPVLYLTRHDTWINREEACRLGAVGPARQTTRRDLPDQDRLSRRRRLSLPRRARRSGLTGHSSWFASPGVVIR